MSGSEVGCLNEPGDEADLCDDKIQGEVVGQGRSH